ncbi:MAG: RagB/SusD family nutrient uptake outer membrane protein, partial [Paramuribaculum sp.]|nr:RagB/SusD family nutrient uptake outer membrane protein [Paramuribaculum sp.]
MKKLFISLFAAAALLPFSVSCDSGANEPDAPIESGNPADSIPADTLPSDTIPTDTVPPVT